MNEQLLQEILAELKKITEKITDVEKSIDEDIVTTLAQIQADVRNVKNSN